MRLRAVRQGEWRVLAICTGRGDCPLLGFLGGIEGSLRRDQLGMLKLLERVAQVGPPRNAETSKKLSADIFELRFGQLRVLWFYAERRIVVCSHGFVKRSQKTPAGELARVERACREYRLAQAAGTLSEAEEP